METAVTPDLWVALIVGVATAMSPVAVAAINRKKKSKDPDSTS